MPERILTRELPRLFELLREDGFQIVGPTLRDGAILYDRISSADELPVGWTDEQGPGHYRVKRRDDAAHFGFTVGPHSWKQFLFPPREELVHIRRGGDKPEWTATTDETAPLALLGVRACELAAIDIQDRVFAGGPYVDPRYLSRRERNFVIAVGCTEAGELCFCSSMKTGPMPEGDYDLRMVEIGDELLIDAGSERGAALLDRLPTAPASEVLAMAATQALAQCATEMGRQLDTTGLPARIMGNLDHPRWAEVAGRCLSCGNCTSVCPTCFCSNVVDSSDLVGSEASRERVWDSCFSADHSTIHGTQFRGETRSRYQQWLTHKLATWTSQFGSSGCVGCGRCIAWCPVGIDITEEVAHIASGPGVPMVLPAPRNYPSYGHDGLLPSAVQLRSVSRETADTVTLRMERPEGYDHGHGQFNMLSVPGIGDVPISIAGSRTGELEHTVRAVGKVTEALAALRPGAYLGLRGPYGTSWPVDECRGKKVIIIAGGIGLAPLRSAMLHMIEHPDEFPSTRLLYGTRSPDEILYNAEILGWMQSSHIAVHVTVDRGSPGWTGNIGVVTKLLRRKHTPVDGRYLLCGPEIMMRFALDELSSIGVPPENIYLSIERNMKCAVGMCGRCQYGPHFVCKDGPVFRYDQIKPIFGKAGF